MKKKETVRFYQEWLSLPKDQFRILLHLARFGSFSGNLSDLLRSFSLSLQDNNRKKLRKNIEVLAAAGIIECTHSGNNYKLQLIPKEKEIHLPCAWVDAFTSKPFSRSVAKEQVIKILLWLVDYGSELFTNDMIAADLKISVSTIGEAKNVLKNDFEAIMQEIISVKNMNGEYRRIGQTVNIAAWLKDD